MSISFAARPCDYVAENASFSVSASPATAHPLQKKTSAVTRTTTVANVVSRSPVSPSNPLSSTAPVAVPARSDPLSLTVVQVGLDPLSQMYDPLTSATTLSEDVSRLAIDAPSLSEASPMGTFKEWKDRKSVILAKYTTSASIPVFADFLAADNTEQVARRPVGRTKYRLEQLGDVDDGTAGPSKVKILSQQEAIKHLEHLNGEIIVAWNKEERVRALKLVIQTARVLMDLKVIQAYPSMFVLATEVLDTFGKLVADRIKEKAIVDDPRLKSRDFSQKFEANDMPEEARETCRNWFYKVASIRELIPRLYVEICLLPAYRFLGWNTVLKTAQRLHDQIRGVGDPLISLYARCYLVRQLHDIYSKNDPVTCLKLSKDSFKDFMQCGFRQIANPVFQSELSTRNIQLQDYMWLYNPAMEWILQVIAHTDNSEQSFTEAMDLYNGCSSSSLVLYNILLSFKPETIVGQISNIVATVRKADTSDLPDWKLYMAIGTACSRAAPAKKHRLPLLNEVWKIITKIEDPAIYCDVALVWTPYVLTHFGKAEADIFLADVLRHVSEKRAYDSLVVPLKTIVEQVLTVYPSFESILALENFMPLLDLFSSSAKVDIAKMVLHAFTKGSVVGGGVGSTSLTASSSGSITASDPVTVHTLLDLARTLHDSLDSTSLDDERRQVTVLICGFIHRVEFGSDLEAQLAFLVECRSSFQNIDIAKTTVILGACRLAVETHRITNGRSTQKTIAFVKGCLAFVHISIPSVDDHLLRLRLFMLGGHVALLHGLLPQAESMFKTAITLVSDVPVVVEQGLNQDLISTEDALVNIIKTFSATLVVVPGHSDPKHGPFYLIKGLLNVLREYDWEHRHETKIRLYLCVLQLLATYDQIKFPYHIRAIESNDTLYAREEGYCLELNAISSKLLDEILAGLAALKEASDGGDMRSRRAQALLSLDTFNLILGVIKLDSESATLAAKLFALAAKNILSSSNTSGNAGGKETGSSGAGSGVDLRAYLTNSLGALTGHNSNALTREMHEKLKTLL